MSMSVGSGGEGSAMCDINTTPLIDIMLVLLIMFLITVPAQTHSVKVDLPGPDIQPNIVNPVKNKIVIDPAGTVTWNGLPVNEVQLRQYLDITQTMTPVPELHLQPHPEARYEVVDNVLAITKRANVEAMGFVGNEAYANF